MTDALTLLKELEDANFPRDQAEVLLRVIQQSQALDRLVSKETFDHRIDRLETRFDERLGRLETKFDERIGRLETEVDLRIDRLETRIDALPNKVIVDVLKWLLPLNLATVIGVLGLTGKAIGLF